MTGRDSISHLCLATLLAGCASVPQLNETQPTAQQARAYTAFLSASDLRAAGHFNSMMTSQHPAENDYITIEMIVIISRYKRIRAIAPHEKDWFSFHETVNSVY